MTDTGAAPAIGGSSACWNCGQPLRAGTVQCLWCGVAQRASGQPAQVLVAPAMMPAAPAGLIPPAPATTPVAPHAGQPPAPGSPQPRTARVRGAALDPVFAGTAAGVGVQLLAFTIDVVVVTAVSVAVSLITNSVGFGLLAAAELAVFLWVLEARTGATVGSALLRLRAARADSPYSPGIGRAFVRRLITGAGFLVGGVGAWVVVGSASWDRSGKNRSWADTAAHTQLVAMPPRGRNAPQAAASATAVPHYVATAPTAAPVAAPAAAPQYAPVEVPLVLAAPHVVSTIARPSTVNEDSVSQSQTGVPQPEFVVGAPADLPVEVPAVVGAAPTINVPEILAGTILLVFDTGQRERFASPVSINLGRNPVATDPTDALVIVQDPDSTVSKTHLRLEHSRGRTWVTDGGSTNGTDLLEDDGDIIALTPGNRVLVEEGVRVRMGNRAFTISLMLGGEK